MRVISGDLKGRRIEAVPGDTTRPSSDMLREAFASVVISNMPQGFEGVSVLDAFAGSGAVGIECLSRGAATCLFVDNEQKAIATITENLKPLPLQPGQTNVQKANTFKLAEDKNSYLPGAPFDIVYIDPPYAVEQAEVCQLINNLSANNYVAPGALIAYEMEGRKLKKQKGQKKDKGAVSPQVQALLDNLNEDISLMSVKNYGKAQVVYLRYKTEE